MIDIHAHLVPGMDDGAENLEDSLEMAQMAVSSSVHKMVALCHANLPGQKAEEVLLEYQIQFQKLKEYLEVEKIPITLIQGMELLSDGNLPELLQKKQVLTLNGTAYVLVEFDFQIPAFRIYEDVDALLRAGYIPVLAHPERYACVGREIAHVYEWQQMGAVIQVNKGSILGRFGERIKRRADLLLKHRIAGVVASDAHRPDFRTTDMIELVQVLEKFYGEASVDVLLKDNPERILSGENVLELNPIAFGRY